MSLDEIGRRVCTDQPSLMNILCGDLVVELCRRQIEVCVQVVLDW